MKKSTLSNRNVYTLPLKNKSRVPLHMSRKVWNRISKTLQKEGMIGFNQFQSYLIELVKGKFVSLKIDQFLAWCSECTQECVISKLIRIKRGNIEFQA